jgi:hypothetical protein
MEYFQMSGKTKQVIPFIDGDENDALSRKAKRYLRWKAGERKRIKRQYNKRARRESINWM